MGNSHTPIRAPRGKWTHAMAVVGEAGDRTLCNRRFNGWLVGTAEVDCPRCLERIR